MAEIAAKLEKYEEIYSDPMAAVTSRMDEVKGRLAKIDSGTETRGTQQEIVDILDDLIMAAEERAQQDQDKQQQPQQ